MSLIKDITGQTFGRLTVLKLAPKPWRRRDAHWVCLCTCGNQTIANGNELRNGKVQGCGCKRGRVSKHGQDKRHDRSSTYASWINMKTRCFNSKRKEYKNYGGRGIIICPEWIDSFEQFYADMGDRPEGKTLDRIDVNGNYEVSNCRWATLKEQANNKRNGRKHGTELST